MIIPSDERVFCCEAIVRIVTNLHTHSPAISNATVPRVPRVVRRCQPLIGIYDRSGYDT